MAGWLTELQNYLNEANPTPPVVTPGMTGLLGS